MTINAIQCHKLHMYVEICFEFKEVLLLKDFKSALNLTQQDSMSPTYIHILQSLILLQTLTHISSTTSVLLTPQNPSQNGASVELIQQSDWDLYATDETAINMKIHLDKSWSFNSQHITTLNLQINSNNLPHTSNTSLIVSFSQNNTKYITSVIETGATNSNSIYTPQYDGKQPYGQGNIEQLLSTSNILDSNDTHGYIPYILSPNFPLTFTLQNHPNFDFMIFTYSYPSAAPKHIIYYGMDTTKPLDIYFSICDMSDNFDITSFNITHSTVTTSLIPHFNTTFYSEQDIKSTQEISKYENISSIDWVKTSLVIILVSTIGILCCLCCLFGIMFTTIINNHKKIILSKHTETTNQHTSDTTTQMETKTSVNVCKSDTNENQTNDNNTVRKTIVITDTIMTMTPPTMANILGDSISKSNIQIIINDDINHHDSIGCNINDDINIVYKEFTRDRLYMDGEVDIKEEKEIIYEMDTKEEKKETDDDIEDMYININNNGTPTGTDIDDMEDMYINNNINNNITPRGNNINNNINNNITPRGNNINNNINN
eukprot:450763_1